MTRMPWIDDEKKNPQKQVEMLVEPKRSQKQQKKLVDLQKLLSGISGRHVAMQFDLEWEKGRGVFENIYWLKQVVKLFSPLPSPPNPFLFFF